MNINFWRFISSTLRKISSVMIHMEDMIENSRPLGRDKTQSCTSFAFNSPSRGIQNFPPHTNILAKHPIIRFVAIRFTPCCWTGHFGRYHMTYTDDACAV